MTLDDVKVLKQPRYALTASYSIIYVVTNLQTNPVCKLAGEFANSSQEPLVCKLYGLRGSVCKLTRGAATAFADSPSLQILHSVCRLCQGLGHAICKPRSLQTGVHILQTGSLVSIYIAQPQEVDFECPPAECTPRRSSKQRPWCETMSVLSSAAGASCASPSILGLKMST